MISRKEFSLITLADYLPAGTYDQVARYLNRYQVQLTITRKRNTVLGDYRHPDSQGGHRITVNGDLNRYAFLITLLHEIAHLVTYVRYGYNVSPHGREWKMVFGRILREFIGKSFMPEDIERAVVAYMENPSARTCVDEELIRTLRRYDSHRNGFCFVEDIEEGDLFKAADGRIYRRGKKIRKRYECRDIRNRRTYLFSPVYEVERVKSVY